MDIKKRIRKYRLLNWTVTLLACGLALYLIFGVQTAWSPILGVIIYFIFMHYWRSFLYNVMVCRVLTHELDPALFLELHERIPIHMRTGRDRIFAAYFSGDYQTTVNICRRMMLDRRLRKLFHIYYSYLARVAFDTGDDETLRQVCDAFERETPPKVQAQYAIMKFYRHYLEKDYTACYALYKGVVQDPKYNVNPFQKVLTRYTFAVACRLCGEEEEAKSNFEYVAKNAGKLHLAALAEGSLRPQPVKADPNYCMAGYDKAMKISRIGRVLSVVLVLIAAALFFLLPSSTYHLTKEECNLLFSCIPQDFVQGGYETAESTPALNTFAELDEQHDLILKLNYLQKMTLSYLAPPENPRITAEGNIITVYGYSETILEDLTDVLFYHNDLLMKQFLNGEELEVYLVLEDGATGKVYLSTPLPAEFTLDFPFSSIK